MLAHFMEQQPSCRQLGLSAACKKMSLHLVTATLLVALCSLQPVTAAPVCSTDASFTALACSSAATAVQALVGNSSGITVNNVAFTGSCAGSNTQLGVITDFGACHYLGTTEGFRNSSKQAHGH
jgi:hypothetical protein